MRDANSVIGGVQTFFFFFARWGSSAISKCVADIPSATITGEVAGSSASASQAVLSLSALLEPHVRDAQDQVVALRNELESLRNQLHPSDVRNTVNGIWPMSPRPTGTPRLEVWSSCLRVVSFTAAVVQPSL